MKNTISKKLLLAAAPILVLFSGGCYKEYKVGVDPHKLTHQQAIENNQKSESNRLAIQEGAKQDLSDSFLRIDKSVLLKETKKKYDYKGLSDWYGSNKKHIPIRGGLEATFNSDDKQHNGNLDIDFKNHNIANVRRFKELSDLLPENYVSASVFTPSTILPIYGVINFSKSKDANTQVMVVESHPFFSEKEDKFFSDTIHYDVGITFSDKPSDIEYVIDDERETVEITCKYIGNTAAGTVFMGGVGAVGGFGITGVNDIKNMVSDHYFNNGTTIEDKLETSEKHDLNFPEGQSKQVNAWKSMIAYSTENTDNIIVANTDNYKAIVSLPPKVKGMEIKNIDFRTNGIFYSLEVDSYSPFYDMLVNGTLKILGAYIARQLVENHFDSGTTIIEKKEPIPQPAGNFLGVPNPGSN